VSVSQGSSADLFFLIQNDDHTGTLDAVDRGILDLLVTKQWAIKLATEAARTVLSVDQIIVARQAGGPKPPGPNPVSPTSRLVSLAMR
jgi:T-complex protein 1 subunit theta